MKKVVINDIDLVIYPRHLYVVYGGTKETIMSNFKDIENDPQECSEKAISSSYAVTFENDVTYNENGNMIGSLVWLHNSNGNISQEIIAHESVHAANVIFTSLEIKGDTVNDEPFAYMVGFIVKKINETLKMKSKQ